VIERQKQPRSSSLATGYSGFRIPVATIDGGDLTWSQAILIHGDGPNALDVKSGRAFAGRLLGLPSNRRAW
jgi:hypothetical protein